MVFEKDAMLAPYRVLDLTNEWGFLCGRLLADLGADVIKIEKPGGDPARAIGPFFHDIPHPEKSLYWYFYNANKRGITLNLETDQGRELFLRLVETADFVIESFRPGYMAEIGLDYASLSRLNPKIILTSITPFGQEGPYSKYKGSDIVVMALSGWMYKCGDADRAPLNIGIPQSYHHASAQAGAATLMAHYYRQKTGEGQHIDVSSLPWITYFSQAPIRWFVTGNNETRHGPLWEWSGRPLVRYIWECKDGSVCFAITGGARFGQSQKAIVEWMKSENAAPESLRKIDWNTLDMGSLSQKNRNDFEMPVAEFLKQKTKAEIFRESMKRGIVLFPSSTAKDILEDPQLASRNYFVDVDHPETGSNIIFPGPFFKSSETSWQINRRAPLIGEHNSEIYLHELGLSNREYILLKENNII